MERLAGHRAAHPQEAHGRRAARLGVQVLAPPLVSNCHTAFLLSLIDDAAELTPAIAIGIARCMQWRHGRAGAGDVDAVQHQHDGAAAAAEGGRFGRRCGRRGGVGRVAGVVLPAAGGRVGGGVRGGADARHGARRGPPGAALRAGPLARHALPFPPGSGPAGRTLLRLKLLAHR